MNVVSVDGGKEDEKEYILNILSRKNERKKEREREGVWLINILQS